MKPSTRRLASVWRDSAGSNAVEFALVAPAFILLIVGSFYTAGLAFAASSLQFATEAAARCASVQTTVCTDSSSIQAYGRTRFAASGAGTPNFAYSASGCGHVVTGTITYLFDSGLWKANVPLNSTACFP